MINISAMNQTKVYHWINQGRWINQGLLKELKLKTQLKNKSSSISSASLSDKSANIE